MRYEILGSLGVVSGGVYRSPLVRRLRSPVLNDAMLYSQLTMARSLNAMLFLVTSLNTTTPSYSFSIHVFAWRCVLFLA